MSVYAKDDCHQLKTAIESVIQNTVVPDEFLIVIDGPVSSEIEGVLNCYKGNSIFEFFYLPENVGLGNALNLGLQKCKFEYVARMDSDDICVPDRFEMQLQEISHFDIVGGFIAEFDIDPSYPYSIRKVPLENDDILNFAKRRCPFNHVTVMYRKSKVLEVGGYFGGKAFQEDYYLWIRMLNSKCHSKNIDKVLVNVRAGENMLYRRTGLLYAINEIKVQYSSFNLGFIGLSQLVFNCLVRFTTRLSPIFIKKFVYSFLR